MFPSSILPKLSRDTQSPFFRHQVLSLLIQQLQHIYVTQTRLLDGVEVYARIDVRNTLADTLQRCHNSVVPDADTILKMADALPVIKSPGAYLPTRHKHLFPAWERSLVDAGSLPVRDMLDAILPAVAFDMPDDFTRLSCHLAIALRLITPGDIDRFYDYVQENIDGNVCAFVLVERYRDNVCQAEFSDTPRCWDGVYDRLYAGA